MSASREVANSIADRLGPADAPKRRHDRHVRRRRSAIAKRAPIPAPRRQAVWNGAPIRVQPGNRRSAPATRAFNPGASSREDSLSSPGRQELRWRPVPRPSLAAVGARLARVPPSAGRSSSRVNVRPSMGGARSDPPCVRRSLHLTFAPMEALAPGASNEIEAPAPLRAGLTTQRRFPEET